VGKDLRIEVGLFNQRFYPYLIRSLVSILDVSSQLPTSGLPTNLAVLASGGIETAGFLIPADRPMRDRERQLASKNTTESRHGITPGRCHGKNRQQQKCPED
jgi:hypothetical protein